MVSLKFPLQHSLHVATCQMEVISGITCFANSNNYIIDLHLQICRAGLACTIQLQCTKLTARLCLMVATLDDRFQT